MTPETVIMIASVSKVFAGAAILKLVSRGIINLDDDICKVLPSGYDASACRNPAYPNTPVTWRMLVTHRSSLRPNIPSVGGYEASYGPSGGYTEGTARGNPSCPLKDVVGFYRDFMIDKPTQTSVGSGLNVDWYKIASKSGGSWKKFKPGSKSLYSNFAVGYIAALIEHLSGKPFQDFCRDELFKPLGMDNTAWLREDLPNGVRETQPVEYWGGKNPFEDVGHYCFIDYASGSLRTTAKDMAIFLDSMLNYGAPTLWSKESGKTAVRCAEEGSNTNTCEFGINWILMKKDKAEDWLKPAMNFDWTDAVMHDGAEIGTQTQVLLFPQEGVYAIVFTNTDGNNEWAAQKMMKEVLLKAPTLNPPVTNAPVAVPTKAPSTPTPPTPACSDNCNFTFDLDSSPTLGRCSWITKNKITSRARKTKYCGRSTIKRNCPATCDSNCTNDQSFTFSLRYTGTKVKCNWMTKNRKKAEIRKGNYCGNVFIASSCPSACGRCPYF